ncbi:MAG: D-glycero-beta-D-manno-heptose 1-phosphate adenylyltransferase [Chitinophagales bacterium]|nr:D-glycero-beta-D-manno-heptose 1-phosphate adenylyltransferase [Chitinophagales bacterium]
MNYLKEVMEQKIVLMSKLKNKLAVWRFQDKNIVFTNGCFDIIHQGHIHLLSTARSFGNVLIVGLNTDASVRKLKPDRPIQDEHSRALIMASFTFVDAVILFDEETPYSLIQNIKPDVLVKGGDYSIGEVVGKDLVEGTGGSIEVVPLLQGLSTTNIVNKMR